MKKLLLALAILFLAPTAASAQCNGIFQPGTACGNNSGSPKPPGQVPLTSLVNPPGGITGQIQYNAGGSVFGGFTASGDATINTSTGVVAVTGIRGIPVNTTGITNNDLISYNGSSFIRTTIMSVLNAACQIAPSVCIDFFGYADPRWFGAIAGGSNSATALQNTINAMDARGGGEILISTGYSTGSTLVVSEATCFIGPNAGAASNVAAINGIGNITVLNFAASKAGACIKGVNIFGYTNVAATVPAVIVGFNSAVFMRDCVIWGGGFALQTAGYDGRIQNCYFAGWAPSGGGVFSTGANFWTDNKIDNGVVPTAFGFYQGAAPALAENHFTNNDFSGTYSQASFASDDAGTSRNVNVHTGSIFSSPILLSNSRVSIFTGIEFGSTVINSNNGPIIIGTSFAFAGTAVTGAAARSCAANISITC